MNNVSGVMMRETLLPAEVARNHVKVTWTRVRREARARFGVDALRHGQMELIEAVFHGHDAFGVLPTGAGKSLCFQLPSLFLPKPTIVVSPLIALMNDQRDHLREANVAVTKVDSTLGARAARKAREGIANGTSNVIYVTPERLENADYLALLCKQGASLFVVDEAHCVHQWGHDFRPAYLSLKHAIRALGRPPVLALTATATPQILADVVKELAMSRPIQVNTGVARPNLAFEVVRTTNDDIKKTRLMEILRKGEGATIVYVATIRAAEELCRWIQQGGLVAEQYHGKLPARVREDVQTRFMAGEIPIIVATNAFGLGIDKGDVRSVVHYNFPDSVERYYQEAGRAGRDGEPARATLLYRLEDRRIQSSFLGGKYPSRSDWEKVCAVFHEGVDPKRVFSLAEVTAESGVRDRRVKVIVAELEAAKMLARAMGGMRRKQKLVPIAVDAVIERFSARLGEDHARIEAVMRYAQSTRCRASLIADYFGASDAPECSVCDNCRTGASLPVPAA